MKQLISISLVLNVIVLVPVVFGLLTSASWVSASYGLPSPAQGILVAVYGAILLVSVGLLTHPVPAMVATLLALQTLYKLSTPVTVGGRYHTLWSSRTSPSPCSIW